MSSLEKLVYFHKKGGKKKQVDLAIENAKKCLYCIRKNERI